MNGGILCVSGPRTGIFGNHSRCGRALLQFLVPMWPTVASNEVGTPAVARGSPSVSVILVITTKTSDVKNCVA
jgi:hypothetical protein